MGIRERAGVGFLPMLRDSVEREIEGAENDDAWIAQ